MSIDYELIDAFIVSAFGEGTEGDVPVYSESGAFIVSRDLDEMTAFVADHPKAFTALATYDGTEIKEVVGIGTGLDHDDNPRNFVRRPSILLRKGDNRFAIWFLDEPVVPASGSHCDILERANKALNGGAAMIGDSIPLAEVDGWVADPAALGDEIVRYSVPQLAKAFLNELNSTSVKVRSEDADAQESHIGPLVPFAGRSDEAFCDLDHEVPLVPPIDVGDGRAFQ